MEITTAGSYVAITKEAKLEFTANRNALHHLSLKEEIPQLPRKVRVSGNFYRNLVIMMTMLITIPLFTLDSICSAVNFGARKSEI